MNFEMPNLRKEEKVALHLRSVFEKQDYQLYRMGSFEEYDLYLNNKSFLMSDDIITFTGIDGRLKALKPDVTLSIVKNTPKNETRKVYYQESVFRRSIHVDEYREINQMGLEYIGGDRKQAEIEVLTLAAQSVAAVGQGTLDLSHMGVVEAVLLLFAKEDARQYAKQALQDKSPHLMRQAAELEALGADMCDRLAEFTLLGGEFWQTIQQAKQLLTGLQEVQLPLQELESLAKSLASPNSVSLRLDFSIINDVDYYNGLIFQGYVQGVSRSMLSGGRYDNLLLRLDKPQGAVGFALYLDEVERDEPQVVAELPDDYLNVALPKGRMGNKVYAMLEQVGFSCGGVLDESRKLIFEDTQNKVRYFLVKPSDVDIYVEHGAADVGVVGKDVLLESGADVLELLDMGLGKCRLAVAGRTDFTEDPALPLRVATKYPNVARQYYGAKSREVEIIKLHGSIELAPLIGLSDVIVDIVETGSTLKENNLDVLEDVAPSSARLVANRAAWRFKEATIRNMVERLGSVL